MRKITWIRFLSFLLAVAVSGCTTIAPPAPSVEKPWAEREFALKQIHSWQLNGKIAVQTAKDSGSATIDWTQQSDHYTVSLLGPLGTNGMKLSGQPGQVTLETSDGKHYTAESPEQLLAKQWGFHLPVSYLTYWVRGLPVPNTPSNTHFDHYGRLSELFQDGWSVQYQSYTSVSKIDLPSKIYITSPSLKTKIIIYAWKLHLSH